MKKKGFTLIELLAVIVVLAIIALIATPIVMNTIKNSKKGAAERSGESYTKQVETSIMEYRMESGNTLPDGEYKITSDGNLCKDKTATCTEENKIKIEMSGTKPNGGSIKIENGQVKKENSSMKVGDYTVSYDETKKTFVAEILEILCKANTTKVSALVYNSGSPFYSGSYKSEEVGLLASESGVYTPGVTYTCNVGDKERTFYVLEESGDNVSLILGTNLGSTVSWANTGFETTIKLSLKQQTAGWTKLKESKISLSSAEQIALVAGQTFNNNSISEIPTWLRSYSDNNVAAAYWTLTSNQSNSYVNWYVHSGSGLTTGSIEYDYLYGIRPVITISKSQLG